MTGRGRPSICVGLTLDGDATPLNCPVIRYGLTLANLSDDSFATSLSGHLYVRRGDFVLQFLPSGDDA